MSLIIYRLKRQRMLQWYEKKKKKLVKNSRTGFRDVCEKVLISDIHSSYTFRCAQKKKWGENKLRNAPQPHTKICKLDKGGRRAGDMQRGTATISTLGWSVCVSFVEASSSTNKNHPECFATQPLLFHEILRLSFKTQHSRVSWHMRLQSVPLEIRRQEAYCIARH